ncbi:MAG: hypothetical protein ACXVAJ_08535, partial [Parachlamydiaceae bacterium]
TDRLLAEMLSVDSAKKKSKKHSTQDNPSVEISFLPPTLNQNMSVDVLIDVYLPHQQIGKIASVLNQKPECVGDFWWRAIFSGYSHFDSLEWQLLALETFSKMDQKKQEEWIQSAFYYSHLQLASLWIKIQSKIDPEAVFSWFSAALFSGNAEAVDVFATHHLAFTLNFQGESLLHKAAAENGIEFAIALKALGLNPDLRNQEGVSPYDYALERQHLTICYHFHGVTTFEELSAHVVGLSNGELHAWLVKAFLRSSSSDVSRFIQSLRGKVEIRILDEILDFMGTSGSLIVRFPSPRTQAEMYAAYGSVYQSYEEQQWMWGLECEKLYQKFYKSYSEREHALLELLMKFAKELPKRKDYDSWRMGAEEASLVTYFCGRYFFFWQFTQKIYKNLLKHPQDSVNELKLTEEGYQILYALEEGTTVPLSHLQIRRPFEQNQFSARMIHTDPKEVKLLIPHLDHLLSQIKNYAFHGGKPISPPLELKKLIARLFWLGCHLAFTARGSSQYMLMLHRLLYHMHGYEVSPWSLRYIQPDCIAIAFPFSIFFEEY